MPMILEAVIARLRAIHSVVFGGFAAHELATRIEDAKPRVVMSASCGIEVSNIISALHILKASFATCLFDGNLGK